MNVSLNRTAVHVKDVDIIVAGGGVAGVAAALTARRMGKSVLLIEKMCMLGGLATAGLINLYVSMCNGRGKKVIKGICEEMVELSTRYGFDSIAEEWKNGEPEPGCTVRYKTRFSAPIFAMALTEICHNEGVELLFDSIITQPLMEGGTCRGVFVENKSGCEFYGAGMFVDTTGDADLLFRGGVPTVQGQNYDVFNADLVTLDTCKKVLETEDMRYLTEDCYGGRISLYGTGQVKPTKGGTTVTDVTNHLVENHIACLEGLKADDRKKRTVVQMPTMCQFRETRRIEGDYTLKESDVYRHFDDSVCVINNFAKRDQLFEVPYRCLTRKGFPNLITAGRCAAGEGFMWDVMRVIPPAILTGQAAGAAAALALKDGDLHRVDVSELQKVLASQNMMIHFDDAWIPAEVDETRTDADHL